MFSGIAYEVQICEGTVPVPELLDLFFLCTKIIVITKLSIDVFNIGVWLKKTHPGTLFITQMYV